MRRVFEVDASTKDLTAVARALGRSFSWHLGGTGEETVERWPACTVMATVKVAVDSYHEGLFWEDLWTFLGVPGPHQKRRMWGEEFVRSLRLTGLDADLGKILAMPRKKYVNAALLHAGVPTYCLDDLFNLLLEWRQQFTTAHTDHFFDWVSEVSRRMDSLDVPARTFLRESREQAERTLDRCVDLLDRLASNPSDGRAWAEAGLPERFQRPALQALVRYQNKDLQPLAHTDGPHLRFAPGQREIHLVLPPQWSTTPDNTEQLAPTDRARSVLPTVLTLSDPLKETHLIGADGERRSYGPIRAEDERLLAFTRQGRAVSLDRDVLPQTLWLLHPRASLDLSAQASVVQQEDLAHSWYWWEASLVDLPPGSWFGSGQGLVHHVASASAPPPDVTFSNMLPGTRDSWGEPVYATRPAVSPPSVGATGWTVQVFARDKEAAEPLTFHKLAKDSTIDPLAPFPHPQVGSFTLRAQRPNEKPHEWHFSLAESVTVSHEPRLRLFESLGLEPARTRLTWPKKFKGTDGALGYGPGRTDHPVRFEGPRGEFSFQVEAPYLQMAFSGTGEHHWRAGAITLIPEDLREQGDLLIRRSDRDTNWGNVSLMLLSPEGDLVQREQPRSQQGSILAFPLPRFTEAAQAYHEVTVELQIDGRTCRVAHVRPEPLASKALFGDDDRIRLYGTPAGAELVATLYQEHAPWRDPVVLPVRDGHISTEEHFEIGGSIRILLRIDDPWTASPRPPVWPESKDGTILVCDIQGRPNSGDHEEDLLCTYLSGRSIRVSLAQVLGGANTARVWSALSRLGPDAPAEIRNRLCALLERIALAPEGAVADYAAASHTPTSAVWALILCGAASTLPQTRTDEQQLTALWEHNPVAAALLSRNAIRMASPSSALDTAVREAVVRRCGPTADFLLRGVPKPRPTPQTTSEHVGVSPANQELFEALRCAPRSRIGLLDSAVERLAVERATHLDASLIKKLAEQGTNVFSRIHDMCAHQDTRSAKTLTQLLAHRSALCPESTRKLPALSLALAVNARLAARPPRPAASVHMDNQYRPLWSDLARAMPELITIDLVLAELTITGLERAQLH
ncbi:hypothetical protein UIS43_07330 [Nocardiopsis sp. LDBS0036]|uniref:hypothetical protein n=1 Tax=Nocardiopsis sp. LDBS0036 TaxID=3104276 RepID=UPI003518566E